VSVSYSILFTEAITVMVIPALLGVMNNVFKWFNVEVTEEVSEDNET